MAEHRTVTAAREGSTPFDPPNSFSIFDFRSPIDSIRDDPDCLAQPIGNRQLAIANVRNCGREVRHLIVDQVDDGTSPFSSAMRQ